MRQREKTLHLSYHFALQAVQHLGLSRTDIPNISATGFLIASKLDELDEAIPFYEDVRKAMRKSKHIKNAFCQQEDFERLEKTLLDYLDWDINVITPYDFMEMLMVMGVVSKSDKMKNSVGRRRQSDLENRCGRKEAKNLNKLIRTLCRASLMMQLQEYKPSHIACACVKLARRLFSIEELWPEYLEVTSGVKEEEFNECTEKLLSNIQSFKLGTKSMTIRQIFPLLGKLPPQGMEILWGKSSTLDENAHPSRSKLLSSN